MKEKLKNFLFKHPKLTKIIFIVVNLLIGRNSKKIKGYNNKVYVDGALLRKVKFKIKGNNNVIRIHPYTRLLNCNINITGNNNFIEINEKCFINKTEFNIEDHENEISIGKESSFFGVLNIAALEGTSIKIGENCLFSSNIDFRSGDSHSILDMNGNRINYSQDIYIGDHVWIGTRALILKGSRISKNTVVGAGSIVSKEFKDPNIIIAGSPAKMVKNNINWEFEKLK